MRTVPAVTSSSPAIMRSSVDLPQPDGPDEHDELAVADPEAHVVDRGDASVEDLRQLLELDLGHRVTASIRTTHAKSNTRIVTIG